MADEITLLRHGEVDNPHGLVYGSLPGFGLSANGRREAQAAADFFSSVPLVAVVSSPLLRARQTAAAVADRHGLAVSTDDRLTEWGLSDRWSGTAWTEVNSVFPGELDAYWEDPTDLPFAPESLAEVADRMRGAVEHAHSVHPAGMVVVVSHQDPIQAALLSLTGRSLAGQHESKPGHASAVTLRPNRPWREVGRWSPAGASIGPPAAGG